MEKIRLSPFPCLFPVCITTDLVNRKGITVYFLWSYTLIKFQALALTSLTVLFVGQGHHGFELAWCNHNALFIFIGVRHFFRFARKETNQHNSKLVPRDLNLAGKEDMAVVKTLIRASEISEYLRRRFSIILNKINQNLTLIDDVSISILKSRLWVKTLCLQHFDLRIMFEAVLALISN